MGVLIFLQLKKALGKLRFWRHSRKKRLRPIVEKTQVKKSAANGGIVFSLLLSVNSSASLICRLREKNKKTKDSGELIFY